MQDHKQMQALLVTYDELDGPTRQQVDDHLATCPACTATLAAYQQSDQALRAWLTQKEMSLREQPSWSSVTPPMWVRQARRRQRVAWRADWIFLFRLRTPLSQAAWTGLLLLLLGLLLFSVSGWLPLAEPVRAATPTVVTATAEAPAIQTTPVVTGEPTTIRFAVNRWDEGNYLPFVNEFEAANPDLQIELVTLEKILGDGDVPWLGADFPKVAAVADVIATYVDQSTIAAGFVRDLRPFIQADTSIDEQDYYPYALTPYEWQGGLWALPSVMNVSLLFYDKAAFDEAGVAYPRPGWTWEDFVATAKAVTLRDDQDGQRWGYVESWYSPQHFIESQAGPLFDNSTTPTTSHLLHADVLSALQRYTELYTVHGVSPYQPRPETDAYAESPLIDLGQAAMWPDSSSSWRWRGQGRNLGVVSYPTNGSRTHTSQVEAFATIALSAQSSHPEAAWRWMSFLSTKLPESYAMGDFLPARQSVAAATQIWEKMDPELATVLHYALEHSYPPYYVDAVLNSLELRQALDTAFAAILQGQKPAEAAMAEVQAVAERALATAPASTVTATPVPSTEPALENRTTITYIAPYGRTGQDDLYNLVGQFETSHPTITVQIADALLRDPLDLSKVAQRADCFNWTPIVYEPDGRNLVLPLDALLATDPTVLKDDFYAGLLSLFTQAGQVWGLPAAAQPKGIGYNKQLFDEAGVDYPTTAWTTADFLRLAQLLTAGDGAAKQYGFVGDSYELADAETFLQRFGGSLYDSQSEPPGFRFDDPTTSAALRWFADLAQLHRARPTFALGMEELAAGRGDLLQRDALIRAGQAAMWSTFMEIDLYTRPYRGEVGIAPLPLAVDGSRQPAPLFAFGYYISAQSTQPTACWAWLRFLSQQPTASNAIPDRRSVVQSAAYRQQVGEEQSAIYDQLLAEYEFTAEAQVLARHPWLEGAKPLLERAYAQIFAGEEGAEAALAQAQQQANAYRACIITKNAFAQPNIRPTCLPE